MDDEGGREHTGTFISLTVNLDEASEQFDAEALQFF
jgi:hypothetical protein